MTREKVNGSNHRAKGGRREDIGIYVRSSWEANYARYLNWLLKNRQIQKWEYEPDTFRFDAIKRGCRSYMPDFKVTELNGDIVYHEVKGYMDQRSRTALKRMGKYYPNVKVIVIDGAAYKRLEKQCAGGLVKNWE